MVQYVSLDYKVPFLKYGKVANYTKTKSVERSLRMLIDSSIDFEVRTTVHTSLIDKNDIKLILEDLNRKGFQGNYFLQNFKDRPTIGNSGPQEKPLSNKDLSPPRGMKVKFRNF